MTEGDCVGTPKVHTFASGGPVNFSGYVETQNDTGVEFRSSRHNNTRLGRMSSVWRRG
jgi:hypothetical protein